MAPPTDPAEPVLFRVLDDPDHEVGIESVHALVVAPDGSTLTEVDVEVVRVWDVATGRLLRRYRDDEEGGGPLELEAMGDQCLQQAFRPSPDGSLLAFPADNGVLLLDPVSGAVHVELQCDPWAEPAVAFGPDGSWIAVAGHGLVEVLATADGELLTELDGLGGSQATLGVAPDGSWIAASPVPLGGPADDGAVTARIWDPRSGEVLHTLPAEVGEVSAFGVAPDGSWLLTVGRRVQLWDPATGALLHTLDAPEQGRRWPHAVTAVAPDGSSFAWVRDASTGAGGTAVVVGEPGGRVRHVLATVDPVCRIRYSPDGRRLAVANQIGTGHVQLWDPVTGERSGSVPGGSPFVFAPDGSWMATQQVDAIGLWSLPPAGG